MKKPLIAMFYILVMLGSGSVMAADASQNQPVKEHAKAKFIDAKTLAEDGCG